MKKFCLLGLLVGGALAMTLKDQESILNKDMLTPEDIARILEINDLVPDGSKPVEYASFLLSGDRWTDIVVREEGDIKEISGDYVRKNLAQLLSQAESNKDSLINEEQEKDTNLAPLERIGDETTEDTETESADETTENDEIMTADETSTAYVIATADETTTAAENTTILPENQPKSGTAELLVENIVSSGHAINWSPTQNCLYIADLWGMKFIRFEEIAPVTTTFSPTTTEVIVTTVGSTVAPETATTEDSAEDNTGNPGLLTEDSDDDLFARDADSTDSSVGEITTDASSRDITTADSFAEETTVAPAEATTSHVQDELFDIRELRIPREFLFLSHPWLVSESEYAFIVPVLHDEVVYDEYDQIVEMEIDVYPSKVLMGMGNSVIFGEFNATQELTKIVTIEEYRAMRAITVLRPDFHVQSSAFVDPLGRLITGTYDIRPLDSDIPNSKLCIWDRALECFGSGAYDVKVSRPTGMSFSLDNSTLYIVDSNTRNLYSVPYNLKSGEMSAASKTLSLNQLLEDPNARPFGLVTDENGHLWVGISSRESGTLVEINPDTDTIISSIDLPESDITDIKFGGKDFEFMYILTKRNIYKIQDIGVKGKMVSDFNMIY